MMKIIIIGGVAGGASAAARLRRLDEAAQIILLERGEYVSYASCGLPYYISGEIAKKSALTVQTPESLRARLNLDVRTGQEAIAIDPEKRQVRIRVNTSGEEYTESYDKLLLSPGAEPIRPAIPGVEDPRVFTLRTLPDAFRLRAYLEHNKPKTALVVGAGFIGLEMAENLAQAGLAVTVAEMAGQVIAPLDVEMAADVHQYLRGKGVDLRLSSALQAILPGEGGLSIRLAGGEIKADIVLLSLGVRPESSLARAAGLEVNSRGAIVVDAHMRTSDAHIYAVGDAVASRDLLTGQTGYVPLAGPANKQGRIVADNIMGIPREYKGTQATAILKLFDLAVAVTGLNEAAAQRAGLNYDAAYLTTASHAGYYPGAKPLRLKVLFENGSGRILGAQAVGLGGVDKLIDVLAAAVRHGFTAEDLTELEHAYAPPFSSAKDPVNMAGFIIQNLLEGQVRQYHWRQIEPLLAAGETLFDVRRPAEYAAGHIPGAVNIPLDELRQRMGELPTAKPLYIYCQSGQRSYLAARLLAGNGFDVRHLAGGYQLYASAVLGYSPLFEAQRG